MPNLDSTGADLEDFKTVFSQKEFNCILQNSHFNRIADLEYFFGYYGVIINLISEIDALPKRLQSIIYKKLLTPKSKEFLSFIKKITIYANDDENHAIKKSLCNLFCCLYNLTVVDAVSDLNWINENKESIIQKKLQIIPRNTKEFISFYQDKFNILNEWQEETDGIHLMYARKVPQIQLLLEKIPYLGYSRLQSEQVPQELISHTQKLIQTFTIKKANLVKYIYDDDYSKLITNAQVNYEKKGLFSKPRNIDNFNQFNNLIEYTRTIFNYRKNKSIEKTIAAIVGKINTMIKEIDQNRNPITRYLRKYNLWPQTHFQKCLSEIKQNMQEDISYPTKDTIKIYKITTEQIKAAKIIQRSLIKFQTKKPTIPAPSQSTRLRLFIKESKLLKDHHLITAQPLKPI